jgi:hypothetical protein
MTKNIEMGFMALACALTTAACAIEDEGAEEGEEEESTVVSALCSDGAANAVVAFDDLGGESAATSSLPTNSYDHPACSDRYAVEVTGVSAATDEFSVIAGWGEAMPQTQSQCDLAFANVQTHQYGHQGFSCSGQFCIPQYGWSQVGADITLRGKWLPDFGGYRCRLVADSPLPVFQPSLLRSKVRVSVRAYAWALFFPAFKKAKAGVYSQPIIY